MTFHAPGMASEAVRRSMRALAREIMPLIVVRCPARWTASASSISASISLDRWRHPAKRSNNLAIARDLVASAG
jgi:hypothetical protein